ncbi:MAG: protease inhibitor I42 family protein [Flavisolibacter sp.]
MKSILVLLILFIAGCTENETAKEKTFTMKKGDEFTIKIDANHTTPYRWYRIGVNPNLDSISKKYFSEGNNEGAGGMEHWVFRAKEKGLDTLRFVQATSDLAFDSLAPVKIFFVSVE